MVTIQGGQLAGYCDRGERSQLLNRRPSLSIEERDTVFAQRDPLGGCICLQPRHQIGWDIPHVERWFGFRLRFRHVTSVTHIPANNPQNVVQKPRLKPRRAIREGFSIPQHGSFRLATHSFLNHIRANAFTYRPGLDRRRMLGTPLLRPRPPRMRLPHDPRSTSAIINGINDLRGELLRVLADLLVKTQEARSNAIHLINY